MKMFTETQKQRSNDALQSLLYESALQEIKSPNRLFEKFELTKNENILHVEATNFDGENISHDIDLDSLIDLAFLKVLKRINKNVQPETEKPFLVTDEKLFLARIERLRDQTGEELFTYFIDIYQNAHDKEYRADLMKYCRNLLDPYETIAAKDGNEILKAYGYTQLINWLKKVKTFHNKNAHTTGVLDSGISISDLEGVPEEHKAKVEILIKINSLNDESNDKIKSYIDELISNEPDEKVIDEINKVCAMVDFYINADGDQAKQEFALTTLNTLYGLEIEIGGNDTPLDVSNDTGAHTDVETDVETDSQTDSQTDVE